MIIYQPIVLYLRLTNEVMNEAGGEAVNQLVSHLPIMRDLINEFSEN